MLPILILVAAVSDTPTASPAPAPAAPIAAPKAGCRDCSDYDQPPRILRQPRPVYPSSAAVEGAEGTVVLEIIVSETGEPSRLRVVESIPALDAAALENAREWRFAPATRSGTPVRALVYGEVHFRLDPEKETLSRSIIVAPERCDEAVPKLVKRLRD